MTISEVLSLLGVAEERLSEPYRRELELLIQLTEALQALQRDIEKIQRLVSGSFFSGVSVNSEGSAGRFSKEKDNGRDNRRSRRRG
jgi:hypothetical protein